MTKILAVIMLLSLTACNGYTASEIINDAQSGLFFYCVAHPHAAGICP